MFIEIFCRFEDVYAKENVKAALLHPFFKGSDFLESSDAPTNLRESLINELKVELTYIQDMQNERPSINNNSNPSSSHQTVCFE